MFTPESFSGPRGFARRFLRQGNLPFRPLPNGFHFDGHAFQMVLFRESCWQIELIVLQPNVVVPQHRHDHCATVDVYLGGAASMESISAIERQYQRILRGVPTMVSVPAGTAHGGAVGPRGLAFLSFQQWSNEAKLIHEDWQPC